MRYNDKNSLEVVRQSAVSQGKSQWLLLEEVEAKSEALGKKYPETNKAVKPAHTSTLIIPPSPSMGGGRGQLHFFCRVRTDKETFRVKMPLAQVILIGGQAAEDITKEPSS